MPRNPSITPALVLCALSLVPGDTPLGAAEFIRGDANADAAVDISDAVFTLASLFLGGPVPPCLDAADSNDDGKLDITDPIYTLSFLFQGGTQPPLPFPLPGADPTPDEWSCMPMTPEGIDLGGELGGAASSPDGKWVAAFTPEDAMVHLVEARPLGERIAVSLPGTPIALELTPDSTLALAATLPAGAGAGERTPVASLQLIDLGMNPGMIVASVATAGPGVQVLKATPGSELALVLSRRSIGSPGGTLSIVGIKDRRLLRALPLGARPHDLEVLSDGKSAAVSSEEGTVEVIDLEKLEVARTFKGLGTPTDILEDVLSQSLLVAHGDVGPAFRTVELKTGMVRVSRIRGPVATLFHDAQRSLVWTIDPERTRLQFEQLDDAVPTGKTGVILLDPAEEPTILPGSGPGFAELDDEGRPALLVPVGHERAGVLDLVKGELVGATHLGGEVLRLGSTSSGLLGVVATSRALFIQPAPAFHIDKVRPTSHDVLVAVDFFIDVAGDECAGNALVLADDGRDDPATSLVTDAQSLRGGANLYWGLAGNAAARFYGTMPDIFDYCVVFYSSDWWGMRQDGRPIDVQPDGGGNAYHSWVRNFTRGTGFLQTPEGGIWGNLAPSRSPPLPTRRLQGLLHMNDLGDWGPGQTLTRHPITDAPRSGISIFAQELGHRFICFADTGPEMLVRRDDAHYSHAFQSGGSAVGGIGGNRLADLGGGTFQVVGQEDTFGPLDLYLMGLIPASEVPDMFVVTDPVFPASRTPMAVGETFTGTRRNVSMAEITAYEGPRIPDHTLSQRVFTLGVALCVPAQRVRNSDLVELDGILASIRGFFETQAGGRVHLVTKTCPLMFSTEQASIPAGRSPGAVAIGPTGESAYIANLLSGDVSIIGTVPGTKGFHKLLKNLDVVEKDSTLRPIDVAVSAEGARLFVLLQNAGSRANGRVGIFDLRDLSAVASIEVGDDPRAMALARSGPFPSRAYVANQDSSTISVIDTSINTTVTTWSDGVSLPRDIKVSGDGLVVLWTNTGDNTVASRHLVTGRIISVPMPDAPHKLALVQNESVVNNTSARALSSNTPPALVYVTSSIGNRVYPFDLRTITGLGNHVFDRLHENPDGSATPLVPPIEVEASPQGVAFLQNGAVALVTHRSVDKVSIIETATHRVLQTVTLSGEGAQGPVDLAITPDGDRAYVACELSHTVKALR